MIETFFAILFMIPILIVAIPVMLLVKVFLLVASLLDGDEHT